MDDKKPYHPWAKDCPKPASFNGNPVCGCGELPTNLPASSERTRALTAERELDEANKRATAAEKCATDNERLYVETCASLSKERTRALTAERERDEANDRAMDAFALQPGCHADVSKCPTWYDSCHCTSEALREVMTRALTAESERDQFRTKLEAEREEYERGRAAILELKRNLEELRDSHESQNTELVHRALYDQVKKERDDALEQLRCATQAAHDFEVAFNQGRAAAEQRAERVKTALLAALVEVHRG